MKRWLLSGFIFLTPIFAEARCNYVRSAYKVLLCKPQSQENYSADLNSSTVALPGLEEGATGPVDVLTCECDYVLAGSNPFCESDHNQEFTQTYPQDPSAPVCKRGKSLCASVCPKVIR